MANPEHHVPDESSISDIEKGDMFQTKDEAEFPNEDQLHVSTIPSSEQEPIREDQVGATIPKQEPNLTDWDGPDDPENPQNWSMSTRIYHVGIPALLGFAV